MQQTDIHRSRSKKSIGKVPILGGISLFAAATLSIPFIYPTETLWYKVGLDKIMLQAGQFAGLLTLILLVLQVLLALRPQFLERAFAGATLMRWHRANGVLIAASAISHVFLVLAPEGLANLPVGWRYWPEMLGAVTLCSLLITVALSRYRTPLKLNYQRWRTVHRPLGYLIVLLLTFHVLFVSESFAAGLPRIGLLAVIILLFFGAALAWIRRGRKTSPKKTTI
ncbi:MAG: ferric reductase-like transmembrane domain-containing protein [Desulfobulbus sp.]